MNQSKRRTMGIVSAVTMAGVTGLGTSASWAQQKPLKQQLIGAWMVVSQDVTPKGGTKRPNYGGPNPKGILILDASGKFAWVYGRPDRPKLKPVPDLRANAPAAELGEGIRGFGANYGTWSVNEADKTLIRKFELAVIANNDNLEQKFSVSLVKDELKLVGVNTAGTTSETVLRRAK